MSFYTSNNAFIPGGAPGAVLFIDPASPNPGAVTTDSFFTFDPTNDRLRIWSAGLGAGIDIGAGNMRISLTGNFGIGIGTQAGTSYFNVGSLGAGTDVRGIFSNLTIGGASSDALIDIAGTWGTTGTPTGIKLNVTDTASNAASLLMDLQIGGASRFSVSKAGSTVCGSFAAAASFAVTNSFNIALWNNAIFGWSASGAVGPTTSNIDLALARDAANTLAQRNGVNAQTLRVYNTFTDASNYERAMIQWISNALRIGTQNAGTGTLRSLEIWGQDININTAGTYRWFWQGSTGHLLAAADNAYDIGSSGIFRPRNAFWAGYQEMSEMAAPAAPAANSVRIYAEDNGSGKTRLMARFATGAAQQIAIEP